MYVENLDLLSVGYNFVLHLFNIKLYLCFNVKLKKVVLKLSNNNIQKTIITNNYYKKKETHMR